MSLVVYFASCHAVCPEKWKHSLQSEYLSELTDLEKEQIEKNDSIIKIHHSSILRGGERKGVILVKKYKKGKYLFYPMDTTLLIDSNRHIIEEFIVNKSGDYESKIYSLQDNIIYTSYGKKISENVYKETERSYYDSGQLYSIKRYTYQKTYCNSRKNQKKIGLWEFYTENGDIIKKKQY